MSQDDQEPRVSRRGGAVLEFHDARVSKLMAWFFGALGMTVVALLGVAANNLYQLNVTVARGMDSDAARDLRLNDHEERLRSVERDLSTVEGRVMRGIEEASRADKEPRRGK